mgnify:CR=1 FL=1
MRSIIRSNQNAIMYRHTNGSYSIFENRAQSYTYRGTLNACKKAWNRWYSNSRQFVVSGRHCDL